MQQSDADATARKVMTLGGLMIAFGLVGMAIAYFLVDPSVSTSIVYGPPEQVINVGRLADRMLAFLACGILAGSGVVVVIGGYVASVVERR